jgi:cytochrome c-type biogenesis protein CcmH/NrfG
MASARLEKAGSAHAFQRPMANIPISPSFDTVQADVDNRKALESLRVTVSTSNPTIGTPLVKVPTSWSRYRTLGIVASCALAVSAVAVGLWMQPKTRRMARRMSRQVTRRAVRQSNRNWHQVLSGWHWALSKLG